MLQAPVRLYKHPDPVFEITYSFDEKQDTIDFLHLSAPALQVSRDVFVSYSHDDRKWLEDVLEVLEPLEELGLKVWVDTDLEGGQDWHAVLTENLEQAAAAILLVSQTFLDSEYIRQTELPVVLKRASQGKGSIEGIKLLWIPIEKSKLEKDSMGKQILQYQAIIDPKKPLGKLKKGAKRTSALAKVQKRIARALKLGG